MRAGPTSNRRLTDAASFLSLARAGSLAGPSIGDTEPRSRLRPSLPSSFWASVHRHTLNDSWPPTNSARAGQFVEKCYWHGLLPLLFSETGLPPIVASALEAARGWEWILAGRSRVLHDAIIAVSGFFADEPFALIKGADYAHRLYPGHLLRAMQDIDVIVPADRFDAACRRAQAAGFVLRPVPGPPGDQEYNEREFEMGDFVVDIHQSFVQRSRHRIDYEAIWERRQPLSIGDQRTFRLEDVDALTYHALSMAIDQFDVRLIRFVDLWLLLHQREGVALEAAERAREWQAARAFYGALSQACRLFPEFRTAEVGAAMERALSGAQRRFVDRLVLPSPAELRHGKPPRRALQIWRKACLLDTPERRMAFAFSHTVATFRGWIS